MRFSRTNHRVVRVALIIVVLNSLLALPNSVEGKFHMRPVNGESAPRSLLAAKPDSATQTKLTEAYGRLPLSFEANEGQADPRVKFVSRAGSRTLFLTATEAVLKLAGSAGPAQPDPPFPSTSPESERSTTDKSLEAAMRISLVGANPAARVTGLDELSGKSNYFIGNDPSKWRTGVKSYSKVRYLSVYPGIDLIYHSDQLNLEYDFKVAPRANPGSIRLAFEGAERCRIDANGELVLRTSCGDVRQKKPIVYQDVRGARKRILARYVMRGRHQIGFAVSRYDRTKPLVIDPVVIYSTYLGGSGLESATAVAVDPNGNAYITGSTNSTNFPTADPLQPAIGGTPTTDVFVTKINPTGSALVYSTYLGGSFSDSGFGIALDSGGNAYVTGQTSSLNFPTANALQGTLAGEVDAFVAKLNSQGSMLVYSSYLGGAFDDSGRAIAVDSFGAAYITGNTVSPDFPIFNALQSTIGRTDAFISKFNSAGTNLVYSTYLGGSGNDSAAAIAVDSDGNAYVTGTTMSSDFPTMNALQPNYSGKTLFKSTDSGASWAPINNGVPRSASVRALAIDPLNAATLYAGTDTDGNYRSTDAGGQWMAATKGLPASPVLLDLAIDPLTPSILYATTWSSGVFKTTNSGTSWDSVLGTTLTNCLAIDPANPSTLYVGHNSQGVLVTTDGGASWENTDFPFAAARVSCLAIDPTHSGSFYVGTENLGINRYPVTCAPIPLSSDPVRCVAVSAGSPSTAYVGTGNGGIYKTTNAGGAWTPVNSGLREVSVNAIAVDPINPLTVYAATPLNCYKSTDGGDAWSLLTVNPQSPTVTITEIAIDPVNTSTLYAAATGGSEAYVTQLNSSGSALVFSTFFGGSGGDSGAGIAVDSSHSVYIAGSTNSLDIPGASPLRPFSGDADAMVARISPDGAALVFFTYHGGSRSEGARALSIDPSGNVWMAGILALLTFPQRQTLILPASLAHQGVVRRHLCPCSVPMTHR